MRRYRTLYALLSLWWLVPPPSAWTAPQEPPPTPPPGVEAEDLPDEALAQEVPYEELEELFTEATSIFQSADQAESLPLFTRIIDELQGMAQVQDLDPRALALLIDSLSRRAQGRFNFGEDAEADLRRVITLDPTYTLDRSRVARRLADLFDSLHDQMVGYLQFIVNPPDTRVTVDEVEVDPLADGPVAVLAGARQVDAERVGYSSLSQEVEVVGGETRSVDVNLERTSPVLTLVTRPPGVTILVDGTVRGTTEGLSSEEEGNPSPTGTAGGPLSAELHIGDLELGPHNVEARRDGYRTYRGRIDTPELRDYLVPRPIVLERSVGTVLLHGLSPEAVVKVDAGVVTPQRPAGSTARLVLAPGTYTVAVEQGTLGVFETRVEVEDAKTTDLQVELRPAVVLLGILGGDEVGAGKLLEALKEELAELAGWTLLDRSIRGPDMLSPLGVSAARLRRLAQEDQAPAEPFAWGPVQAACDEKTPGAVYLLGVLSDDLLAKEADLWIWPAAPGPNRPDRKRILLEERSAVAQLAAAFSSSVGTWRPSLGALLIDSEAAAAPVVAHLTPGGPGEAAGLKLGDEVSAIDGTPAFTAVQIEDQLRTLEPGAKVALEVQGPSGKRNVDLELGRSPQTVDLADPDLIYAAVSAEITAALHRDEVQIPRWVLELNQAAVLLHGGAYQEAVRVLRQIQAPSEPGLGQAAVDYWLGIALSHAGASYTDAARDHFSRAAAATQGRLFHDDGPWLTPRARARLTNLGGPTP